MDRARLDAAQQTAVAYLLRLRHPDGYWEGRLSSSALSTATAVSALSLARCDGDRSLIRGGVAWLCQTQNADGGWGDTPESPSNLATTLLATSALRLAGDSSPALPRADRYITARAGQTPEARTAAITALYGNDRTFAVPILLNCALAGLVPWEGIPGLPFELAVIPHRWYKAVRLHVVSYALPALIAVGLQLDRQAPPRNPLLRAIRKMATPHVLRKLAAIQPESGGYLEAAPLTSFVAMSLLPIYGAEHPVIRNGLAFLRATVRADGSWPIDTDLSVWMTTTACTVLGDSLPQASTTRRWIADRQYRAPHPYTNAAPGGWGWTHHSGSVPDADDTSGALLALAHDANPATLQAGVGWLLQLQNRDGGWPTFCQGWGHLPFDTSSPDVTAHALRALHTVAGATCRHAIRRGLHYLETTQRDDGSWLPLWFGRQGTPEQTNPVFGTARVLRAFAALAPGHASAERGIAFLLSAQQPDGGWGGDRETPASVEETGLSLSALSAWAQQKSVGQSLARGLDYLVSRIEEGSWTAPSPIGLYFANLWYSEALYPVVWTIDALNLCIQSDKSVDWLTAVG